MEKRGGYDTDREILTRNRIEYIIVEAGDTPEALRDELDLYRNEIFRYNDLEKDVELTPGQLIYLQPKRRKAEPGNKTHVVQEGETLYDISQLYGVKVKHLRRINLLDEGAHVMEGDEINLRNRKREPILKINPVEEEKPEGELEFRFENGE